VQVNGPFTGIIPDLNETRFQRSTLNNHRGFYVSSSSFTVSSPRPLEPLKPRPATHTELQSFQYSTSTPKGSLPKVASGGSGSIQWFLDSIDVCYGGETIDASTLDPDATGTRPYFWLCYCSIQLTRTRETNSIAREVFTCVRAGHTRS